MNVYSEQSGLNQTIFCTNYPKKFAPSKIDYLATIVGQLPGYMYVKEYSSGKLLACTAAIAQLFGTSEIQEIIGIKNSDLLGTNFNKELLSISKLFQTYEEMAFKNSIQYKNILSEPFINTSGRVVRLEMCFTPIINQLNKVVAIQFYAVDISSYMPPSDLLQTYQKLYSHQKMASYMFSEHMGLSQYITPNISLTLRELDILIRFSAGRTAKEIAREIAISPRTAEKHLDKIKEKMNVKNRIQLMRIIMGCFSSKYFYD